MRRQSTLLLLLGLLPGLACSDRSAEAPKAAGSELSSGGQPSEASSPGKTEPGKTDTGKSQPENVVGKRLSAAVRAAGKQLQLRYRGPKLGSSPVQGSAPADAAVAALHSFQQTLRTRMRRLLQDLARSPQIRVDFELDSDPQDVEGDEVQLSIADRARTLRVSGDLCDLDFTGVDFRAEAAAAAPRVAHWHAVEQIALAARGLLRRHRIVIAGAVAGTDAEGFGKRFARLRRALEQRGFELSYGSLQGADLVLLLDPTAAVDVAALRRHLEGSGRILCTLPQDAPQAALSSVRSLFAGKLLTLGHRQIQSGVKDPMSKETMFGSETARIVLVEDSFSSDCLVTTPLRYGGALVELLAAHELGKPRRLPKHWHARWLLRTAPYAWLGRPKDRPQDKKQLTRFDLAWLLEHDKGAALAVIAARCFHDEQFHVGNANLEFAMRLIEFLAYR